MSETCVLVHGAWHTGAELDPSAEHIRKLGLLSRAAMRLYTRNPHP